MRDGRFRIGFTTAGRPDLAEAGGKNPDNLPEALKAALDVYRRALAG